MVGDTQPRIRQGWRIMLRLASGYEIGFIVPSANKQNGVSLHRGEQMPISFRGEPTTAGQPLSIEFDMEKPGTADIASTAKMGGLLFSAKRRRLGA